jgi:hypothetical protein
MKKIFIYFTCLVRQGGSMSDRPYSERTGLPLKMHHLLVHFLFWGRERGMIIERTVIAVD